MFSIYLGYPNGCILQDFSPTICYYNYCPNLTYYITDEEPLHFFINYKTINCIFPLVKNVRCVTCDKLDKYAYCNLYLYEEEFNVISFIRSLYLLTKLYMLPKKLKLQYEKLLWDYIDK